VSYVFVPYPRRAGQPRFVYFAKPVGREGPIKIGVSFDVERRVASLSAQSPVPIELLGKIEGDADLERQFHREFAADRCHGEWFKWSERLQETIDATVSPLEKAA
jgi:hypothetical protein